MYHLASIYASVQALPSQNLTGFWTHAEPVQYLTGLSTQALPFQYFMLPMSIIESY